MNQIVFFRKASKKRDTPSVIDFAFEFFNKCSKKVHYNSCDFLEATVPFFCDLSSNRIFAQCKIAKFKVKGFY